MSNIKNIIKNLKEKQEILKNQQLLQEQNRKENDIIQFYEDSLKFSNVTDGMVVIITEDNIYNKRTQKGESHLKTTQNLLNEMNMKYIDLSKVEGDFGNIIPIEYNSIFIRIASVLNGLTIIYYPHVCNEYQINQLDIFNENVKKYNSNRKEFEKVTFVYNGKSEVKKDNLDELLETLRYRAEREKSKNSKI